MDIRNEIKKQIEERSKYEGQSIEGMSKERVKLIIDALYDEIDNSIDEVKKELGEKVAKKTLMGFLNESIVCLPDDEFFIIWNRNKNTFNFCSMNTELRKTCYNLFNLLNEI